MAPLPMEPCLCLSITITDLTANYLNEFKSEGMEVLVQSVRDYFSSEISQLYDVVPRSVCYVSLIPAPHPTGQQLLVSIGGVEHPTNDVDTLLRMRAELSDFLQKSLCEFITKKGCEPNKGLLAGVQVWGTVNLFDLN